MNEQTALAEFDQIAAQFLAMPSRPAILLHTIAYELESGEPHQVLTHGLLTGAMNEADSEVHEEVPERVADEARRIAVAVLPELCTGDTGLDYAGKLRAAARSL
jgi:hypothetical protein